MLSHGKHFNTQSTSTNQCKALNSPKLPNLGHDFYTYYTFNPMKLIQVNDPLNG